VGFRCVKLLVERNPEELINQESKLGGECNQGGRQSGCRMGHLEGATGEFWGKKWYK